MARMWLKFFIPVQFGCARFSNKPPLSSPALIACSSRRGRLETHLDFLHNVPHRSGAAHFEKTSALHIEGRQLWATVENAEPIA